MKLYVKQRPSLFWTAILLLSFFLLTGYAPANKPASRPVGLAPAGQEEAQTYLAQGLTAHQVGQYRPAIAHFTQALELDPDLAEAYVGRGMSYVELNQDDQALADFDQATELDPDLAGAYTGRAIIYVQAEQFEQAANQVEEALRLDPDQAEAYVVQAIIDLEADDLDQAQTDVEEAIRLKPGISEPHLVLGAVLFQEGAAYDQALASLEYGFDRIANPGELDAMRELLQSLLMAEAGVSEPTSFIRGQVAAELKDYRRAVAEFSTVIEQNPDETAAYLERGKLHYHLQNYDQALVDLDQAIELDPDLAEAYLYRGRVYETQVEDRAEADYNQAIELNPELAEAYLYRGLVRSEPEQALADFDQALELDPLLAEAYASRALIHLFDFEDIDQTQADVAEALRLNPTVAMAYVVRGMLHLNESQAEPMLAETNIALRLDPTLDIAYFVRGVALGALDRLDEAATDFEKVIQLHTSPDALATGQEYLQETLLQKAGLSEPTPLVEGQYARHLEDYQEALRQFNALLEENPDDPTGYYERGATYFEMEEYETALADLDQAIELDPDLAEAYRYRAETQTALQNYDQALADYDQVVALAPSPRAYTDRAAAQLGFLGNIGPAEADLEAALQMDPTWAEAYLVRARLAGLGAENPDQALSEVEQAIYLDPGLASAYHYRGTIHFDLEEYEPAISDFSRSIELAPEYEPAYYNRGRSYFNLEAYGLAVSDFSRSIELDPEYDFSYYFRGIAYQELGEEEKALADLEHVLEISTNSELVAEVEQILQVLSSSEPALETGPPSEEEEPSQTAPSAASDVEWQAFSPTDESFTVMLPGTPQKQEQPSGGKSYQVETEHIVCNVTVIDLTDEEREELGDPQEFLALMAQFAVGGMGQEVEIKIISEEEITLDGQPGLAMELQAPAEPSMAGNLRLYLFPNQLYMLLMFADTDTLPLEEALQCINSLEVAEE